MESSNKWYQSYCQKIHQQKLNEIKSKPSRRIDNLIPSSLSVVDRRQKVFQIKKYSNYKELVNENKNIMIRISKIIKKSPNNIQKIKLFNSKSIKATQVPIKRRIKKINTNLNSPISQKTPKMKTKSLASFQISVPRLQLTNINIIQPPSPDTLDQPLPSFTDTPLAMSPSQSSYIKIISASSQSSSKNESF